MMIRGGCTYKDVNASCKRLNLLSGCVSFTVTCPRHHSRALGTWSHHEILAKTSLVSPDSQHLFSETISDFAGAQLGDLNLEKTTLKAAHAGGDAMVKAHNQLL